jgi:hypothetical protein
MVEEYLPMFSYQESGRRYEITGKDGHFFRHLKSKVNEPVKILVSPHDPEVARLGDPYSLYGNGGLLALTCFLFFILSRKGAGLIDGWRSASLTVSSENQITLRTMIDHVGQMTLPVNDVAIVIVSFLLLAGGTLGYAYYYFSKRQNTSLIEAIRARDYNAARMHAEQGLGIDAKNSDGESALIIALKAGQSDVARSILNHIWVNTHATDAKGTSAVQLAALKGDYMTLALLLNKGEQLYDIKPAAIYHLIRKGDTKTLKVLIDNGLDLNQTYTQPSYGDEAVIYGQTDVVLLIRKHNGLFKAPAAFVALASNDEAALCKALEDPGAFSRKFLGLTLERLAEKTGRSDLLEGISGNE